MTLRCSLAVILLWLFTSTAFAADNPASWNYSAPIQLEGSNQYKNFFLTEEVYEHAAASLADLCIVDAQGENVPFYIRSGSGIVLQNKLSYQSELVQSFKKYNDSYLDFRVVPLKSNTDIAGNSLLLTLPAGSFLKHLEVYGSHDGDSWQYIVKDYVFKAEGREKNEVSLGAERKYDFYRIVILDNPENIALDKLNLCKQYNDHQWSSFIKSAPIDFEVKTDKNDSVITLFNKQRLKIKQITLEVETNFQRTYRIYGDTPSEVLLKSGELYNLQLENVKVSDPVISFGSKPIAIPVIKIKLDNRDDRPLVIKAVSIEYYIDKLIFPDMGSGPYLLYFGNDKAVKPNYEIELQQEYIEKEKQDNCSLGSGRAESKSVPLPDSRSMQVIFNGIIVIVSILLIGLLVSRLKSTK